MIVVVNPGRTCEREARDYGQFHDTGPTLAYRVPDAAQKPSGEAAAIGPLSTVTTNATYSLQPPILCAQCARIIVSHRSCCFRWSPRSTRWLSPRASSSFGLFSGGYHCCHRSECRPLARGRRCNPSTDPSLNCARLTPVASPYIITPQPFDKENGLCSVRTA